MSSYKEGQVHMLMDALEEAGWTPDDLTLLGQFQKKKLLLDVLHDRVVIEQKHTIDLAKPPQLPFKGAEVVKHEGKGVVKLELRSDDNLYIDGKKVVLHLSERQMGDKAVVGHELRQELENGTLVLLNSNVFDYLCDHPELFPEHWKKDESGITRYIFFWGSIFRHPSDGRLCVRYLYWGVGVLRRSYFWLGHDWDHRCPSATVAS